MDLSIIILSIYLSSPIMNLSYLLMHDKPRSCGFAGSLKWLHSLRGSARAAVSKMAPLTLQALVLAITRESWFSSRWPLIIHTVMSKWASSHGDWLPCGWRKKLSKLAGLLRTKPSRDTFYRLKQITNPDLEEGKSRFRGREEDSSSDGRHGHLGNNLSMSVSSPK